MVVKIMGSAGSMSCPLKYNEEKVKAGEALVVGMSNMLDTVDPVHDTFGKYERANIRTRNLAFHMSINPGPGEMQELSRVREFTRELMERLGYKDQPFVIYEHDDIERRHYHVVSIRTGPDGRKIRDFLENRNCLRHLLDLAPRYGYAVGSTKGEQMDTGLYSTRFDPAGGLYLQLEAVARDCSRYGFSSWRQFQLLMLAHGVDVKPCPDGSGFLRLQGMDAQGKCCTRPVDERSLAVDVRRIYDEGVTRTLARKTAPVSDMEAVRELSERLLPYSRSEAHFCAMMARNGVDTFVRRDAPGRVIGLTYVDRLSSQVFDSSQLTGFDLSAVKGQESDVWDKEDGLGVEEVIDFASGLLQGVTGSAAREQEPEESQEEIRRRKYKRTR